MVAKTLKGLRHRVTDEESMPHRAKEALEMMLQV